MVQERSIVKVQAKGQNKSIQYFINLPKWAVRRLNLEKGDYVSISTDEGRLVLKKVIG